MNLGVTAIAGTLEEASFPDNSFDVVIMAGLIEHLYEPYQTLCEVRRILKPDGLLWFDAPNEDGLYMTIGNLYMRLLGRDWVVNLAPTFAPFHVQGFNPASLSFLLKRTGFLVREIGFFGSVWPQTGERTIRREMEYRASQMINWAGNHLKKGVYMEITAKIAAC